MMMNISKHGIALIKAFEGFSDTPYRCSAGKMTIGWGHTGSVAPDTPVTREAAQRLLMQDIHRVEATINAHNLTLHQNQYDALCSLIFNIGSKNFIRSTLLKKLKRGERKGAADEFLKWVYAGGAPSSGLRRRRQSERTLFLRQEA